jgi:hypothetical protein
MVGAIPPYFMVIVRGISNAGIEMWQQKLEEVGTLKCGQDEECIVIPGGFAMVREN